MLFKNNQISWIYGKTFFKLSICMKFICPQLSHLRQLLNTFWVLLPKFAAGSLFTCSHHQSNINYYSYQINSNVIQTFSESCSNSQCTSSNHFAYLGKVILKKYLCLCNKNHTQLCWHLGIFCFFYLQGIHYLLVDLRIPKCMRLI